MEAVPAQQQWVLSPTLPRRGSAAALPLPHSLLSRQFAQRRRLRCRPSAAAALGCCRDNSPNVAVCASDRRSARRRFAAACLTLHRRGFAAALRCINSLWTTMSVCAKHVVLRWKLSFSNSNRCCRQHCRGAALLPLCRCRISLLSRHPARPSISGQSACAVGGTWLGEGELGVCGALAHRASRPDLLLPAVLRP